MVKRSRTNSPSLDANQATHEMCPIDADFKHFNALDTKEFQRSGKVSSIMRAKVLSIMRANAGQGTFD